MSDADQGSAEVAATGLAAGAVGTAGVLRLSSDRSPDERAPPLGILARAASRVKRAAPETADDPADADDAELVVRSQAGDRLAFEELVRRTARLLFSRLYLETGDSHRAEDLVQETYLVAWRSVAQVTEPAGFRTWLLSVAHTVRIDAGRREGRKKRAGPRLAGDAVDALAAVPDPAPSPAEAAGRDEQRRKVLALLRELPDDYRAVLTLRYLGGADYETIGRQLGLSNGSLRGLLNRGMARLREKLKVLSAEC